jgi:hypothetical protein
MIGGALRTADISSQRLVVCPVLAHSAQSRGGTSFVAIEGIADIGKRLSPDGSVANDPKET